MSESEIKAGFKFKDTIGEIRVLAVAEGHAMVRRPHSYPFTISLKDIALIIAANESTPDDNPDDRERMGDL